MRDHILNRGTKYGNLQGIVEKGLLGSWDELLGPERNRVGTVFQCVKIVLI